MAFIVSLFLLQADPPGEIAGLIRLLGSEAPEEREQAVVRLKELGSPAIPALEAVSKSTDADLRGRAQGILDHIARAQRVRALCPSGRRITVEFREVPLAEAIRKVLNPFGMTETVVDEALAEKVVSLSLERSTFWEALECLEKTADIRIDPGSGRIQPAGWGVPARSGSGDVRVAWNSWGNYSSGGGPSENSLHLKTWLPPGAWACSGSLEDLELIGDNGKKVDFKFVHGLDGVRNHGLPSGIGTGFLAIAPKAVKGLKSLTVRGTVALGFPRDVERHEILMDRAPASVAILGGQVTVERFSKNDRGDWDVGLAGSGGREPFTVLLSIEDSSGDWLGDLCTMELRPNRSNSHGCFPSLRKGTPGRCVVTRAIGEVAMRIPFTVSSITVVSHPDE
jgi:hypothetical protein